MRVLMADDATPECAIAMGGLRNSGMEVALATDGRTALHLALNNQFDVLVLERNLPGLSGEEVCRRLVAARSNTLVMMLSRGATTWDRVAGLDLGADDYLAKPFDVREFTARVQALGRRRPPSRPTVLSAHDLVLDCVSRSVTRGESRLSLTPVHFAILETLLIADGAVVRGETFARQVWGRQLPSCGNSLRTAMVGLRRVLGEPSIIDTVFGIGYRISAQESESQTTQPRASGSAA
jgi:DNA-binding response OmpR family regulator